MRHREIIIFKQLSQLLTLQKICLKNVLTLFNLIVSVKYMGK